MWASGRGLPEESFQVRSKLHSAEAAQPEARGERLAVGHRRSSVGRAGRHSTEALERILHCVHHHCVPAMCEELPEPRTMRHSNCDSEELDFECNKNGRLWRMSVRQQPGRTGRHWLSNLVPVTKAQTDLP